MNRWSLRAAKLLRGSRTRLGRRALLRGVGASEEHRRVLASLDDVDLVLDVGANRGQFALLCRTVIPKASIESWEPLEGPSLRFRALFGGDPAVVLHQCALGALSGQLLMHETHADDSSSILMPVAAVRGVDVRREVEVNVRRLDDYDLSRHAAGRVLLKIDVQGYEDRVLEGAKKTLEMVSYVLVEMTFGKYYSDQASATEILERLFGAGFEVVGVHNVDTFASGHQADFLLSRVGTRDG